MERDPEVYQKMRNEVIVGVDEAGRGAVVGPLSIAAVAVLRNGLDTLKEVIKYDSKRYSPNKRKELYRYIMDNSLLIKNILIQPHQINSAMASGISLNILEIRYISLLLKDAFTDLLGILEDNREIKVTIQVDSMYNKEVKCKYLIYYYLGTIKELTNNFHQIKIICKNKGDEIFPAVRAASIVAKYLRDREIEKLKHEFGEIGSGYPSDPRTIQFLKNIRRVKDDDLIKKLIRIYWKTWRNVV